VLIQLVRVANNGRCAVGLKIEIHKIHQNVRNPMCIINKNPPSETKSLL